MQTTYALMKGNLKQIKIPINFDINVFNCILSQNLENVHPHYGSMNQILHVNVSPIVAIFLDCFCTLDGNEETRPQADIEILFEQKSLVHESIFALER